MGYTRKRGIAVWGPVWKIGSKSGSDDFGRYHEFVINAPVRFDPARIHTGKVYVRWYSPKFKPEPGQNLECAGCLGLITPGHFETRKDKIRILIRCWGHDVRLLPETERKLTFAQREWGNLVQGPILEGEAGEGTEEA